MQARYCVVPISSEILSPSWWLSDWFPPQFFLMNTFAYHKIHAKDVLVQPLTISLCMKIELLTVEEWDMRSRYLVSNPTPKIESLHIETSMSTYSQMK